MSVLLQLYAICGSVHCFLLPAVETVDFVQSTLVPASLREAKISLSRATAKLCIHSLQFQSTFDIVVCCLLFATKHLSLRPRNTD